MIECWLSFNNRSEILQLPVTPLFNVSTGQNNQTVNLYNKGEINLPGQRGLNTLTLNSFFPHPENNYYFQLYSNPMMPYKACELIEKWERSRRPIRVIFTETNINMAMLIENFDYGQKDGTKDVYFSISLKEYVFLNAKKLSTSGATTTKTALAGSKSTLKKWKINYGDTLTGIALAKFGDSSRYKEILKLNKNLIKNPNSLKDLAGQVIKLE